MPGCGVFGPVDNIGLCDNCAAKLDRDMISTRVWEYSAAAFMVAPEKREAVQAATVAKYGASLVIAAAEAGASRQARLNDGYYWNRENFEGLASLAVALRADPRLEELAEYCDLREKGLRRDAFARLDAFLEQMRRLDASAQRELALQVLEAHWRAPQAHAFLAAPLRDRFLEPVLEQWRAEDVSDPVPIRALALLRRDHELLEEALRLDSKDDRVRIALARILLRAVDYATHHLGEGRFIGDVDDAFEALAKAASLLDGAASSPSVTSLRQELEQLNGLLCDWKQ